MEKIKGEKNKAKNNNSGSVTLESLLIIPFFLFGIIAIYSMGELAIAEAVLYEAAGETVEYMAEYQYIGEYDQGMPYIIFRQYIDDDELINKYIEGGASGVEFTGSDFIDEENMIVLKVSYTKKLCLPFIPYFTANKSFSIRQRAYVGYIDDSVLEDKATEEIIVYVAENESVYHENNNCTHLKLSIFSQSMDYAKKMGYKQCRLCGTDCKDFVYVTETGESYHSSEGCSGLKRTIYEINLKDTNGLAPCSRCGG